MIHSQQADAIFNEKYEMYSDMLYRLCMVYLKNHSSAEDAIQDTFIALIYKSPKFKSLEHEKYWFIRVAINICKDRLKSPWNKKHISMDELENAGIPDEVNEVFHMVQDLPEKYRSVIFLHYIEGFNTDEISKILNIGISAVKMRLKRGRDLLKLELEVLK